MKRYIYLNILALLLLFALFLSVPACLIFNDMMKKQDMSGILTAVLPAVIIITILISLFANIIARKLTNNIVRAINNIDFESENILVYDELSAFVKTIRRQKSEMDERLFELESRADTIEAITRNMKEGLLLVGMDGVILSANASALEIFGEIGMEDKNLLHVCRDIDLLQKTKLCLSGAGSEMLFEKGGKIYNIYFEPVNHDGEISGAILLFSES